jgi:hypothetical protein
MLVRRRRTSLKFSSTTDRYTLEPGYASEAQKTETRLDGYRAGMDEGIPGQIDGIRQQAISEIERYILAYSAAAYGALYAADPAFRADVVSQADPIIGNAMKMAIRHMQLMQELRVQVDEPETGPE